MCRPSLTARILSPLVATGRARVPCAPVRKTRDPISSLRSAIDCLPARTREAMLEGIRAHPIVVGAYTDSRGGICPMLAAHRHGGRTTLLAFARSWDAFARVRAGRVRAGRVLRATRRELAILESQLTASLLASEHFDLEGAIADHEALKRKAKPSEDGRTFTDIKAYRLRPRRADVERALARIGA